MFNAIEKIFSFSFRKGPPRFYTMTYKNKKELKEIEKKLKESGLECRVYNSVFECWKELLYDNPPKEFMQDVLKGETHNRQVKTSK